MKIGDLVNYNPNNSHYPSRRYKAMIVGVSESHAPRYVTLCFLCDAPTWLRQADDGFYHGFQYWQLEVLSEA